MLWVHFIPIFPEREMGYVPKRTGGVENELILESWVQGFIFVFWGECWFRLGGACVDGGNGGGKFGRLA